jgi:hypothetical protein
MTPPRHVLAALAPWGGVVFWLFELEWQLVIQAVVRLTVFSSPGSCPSRRTSSDRRPPASRYRSCRTQRGHHRHVSDRSKRGPLAHEQYDVADSGRRGLDGATWARGWLVYAAIVTTDSRPCPFVERRGHRASRLVSIARFVVDSRVPQWHSSSSLEAQRGGADGKGVGRTATASTSPFEAAPVGGCAICGNAQRAGAVVSGRRRP